MNTRDVVMLFYVIGSVCFLLGTLLNWLRG